MIKHSWLKNDLVALKSELRDIGCRPKQETSCLDDFLGESGSDGLEIYTDNLYAELNPSKATVVEISDECTDGLSDLDKQFLGLVKEKYTHEHIVSEVAAYALAGVALALAGALYLPVFIQ